MTMTRRELFTRWRRTEPAAPAPARSPVGARVPEIVAGHCLASGSFCSVCVERCPRPGAIVVETGRPRIVAAACDGCGRCIAAGPAPVLAIRLVVAGGRA